MGGSVLWVQDQTNALAGSRGGYSSALRKKRAAGPALPARSLDLAPCLALHGGRRSLDNEEGRELPPSGLVVPEQPVDRAAALRLQTEPVRGSGDERRGIGDRDVAAPEWVSPSGVARGSAGDVGFLALPDKGAVRSVGIALQPRLYVMTGAPEVKIIQT
jgi:hypothetical protein